MAYVRYESIAVEASASGDITAYSTGVFTGFVLAVSHVAATGLSTANVPWSTAAGVLVAGEKGLVIFGSSVITGSSAWTFNYPRGIAGLSTGASTGAYNLVPIPLSNERIVITISSNASTGGAVGEAVKVWIGG